MGLDETGVSLERAVALALQAEGMELLAEPASFVSQVAGLAAAESRDVRMFSTYFDGGVINYFARAANEGTAQAMDEAVARSADRLSYEHLVDAGTAREVSGLVGWGVAMTAGIPWVPQEMRKSEDAATGGISSASHSGLDVSSDTFTPLQPISEAPSEAELEARRGGDANDTQTQVTVTQQGEEGQLPGWHEATGEDPAAGETGASDAASSQGSTSSAVRASGGSEAMRSPRGLRYAPFAILAAVATLALVIGLGRVVGVRLSFGGSDGGESEGSGAPDAAYAEADSSGEGGDASGDAGSDSTDDTGPVDGPVVYDGSIDGVSYRFERRELNSAQGIIDQGVFLVHNDTDEVVSVFNRYSNGPLSDDESFYDVIPALGPGDDGLIWARGVEDLDGYLVVTKSAYRSPAEALTWEEEARQDGTLHLTVYNSSGEDWTYLDPYFRFVSKNYAAGTSWYGPDGYDNYVVSAPYETYSYSLYTERPTFFDGGYDLYIDGVRIPRAG